MKGLNSALHKFNLYAEFVSKEALLGKEIPGGGGRGRQYLKLHCHQQNDSCSKMDSGESRFNVLLIVRDKVTKTGVHKPQRFEERGEPKRY